MRLPWYNAGGEENDGQVGEQLSEVKPYVLIKVNESVSS